MTVHGVGVNEKGRFTSNFPGTNKMTKAYCRWKDMLGRCYSTKEQLIRPSYIGTTVCEDFLYFQKFAEWHENQIGSNIPGWQMDKDILVFNNKIYSKETTVFIPEIINKTIQIHNKKSGRDLRVRLLDLAEQFEENLDIRVYNALKNF